VQQRVNDVQSVTKGRTMRLTDVGAMAAGPRSRFTPSVERSKQDRERRHRERAIAAWLRDLSRS
jgi:hypothetical protein